MIRLSVALQHHPLRAEMSAALAERIGGDVDVVVDPDPDNGLRSPWRTYRHALERTPEWATHRLIVQDDAEVCRDFREAATAALAARPESMVAFFVAGSPTPYAHLIYEAAGRGESWAELGNRYWAPVVALCWPTRFVPAMLEYAAAQNWKESFRSDDEIAGRWIRDAGETLWATVPSLVEHPDVADSLIGQRAWGGKDTGRVAACWVGDCDPATIDWAPVERVPHDPAASLARA